VAVDHTGGIAGEAKTLDVIRASLEQLQRKDAATSRVSFDSLAGRGLEMDGSDQRMLSQLLADQVEFANVLIVNKTDLISEEDLEKLQGLLQQLNPQEVQITAEFGKVDLCHIFNTNLFDDVKAAATPGWRSDWITKDSEADEYGFVGRRLY